jgi:putative endonuclease
MWQAYIVLCSDGTLYCGISRDVDVRLEEHNAGKGAKYTRARRPVRLVWFSQPVVTRSEASKLELRIKKLSRSQKWELIKGDTNEF